MRRWAPHRDWTGVLYLFCKQPDKWSKHPGIAANSMLKVLIAEDNPMIADGAEERHRRRCLPHQAPPPAALVNALEIVADPVAGGTTLRSFPPGFQVLPAPAVRGTA